MNTRPLDLLERHTVIFYCIEAKGFIYSPPPLSPEVSHVALHCIANFKQNQIEYPEFPNFQYAAFKIIPCDMSESIAKGVDAKTLLYGQKVELVHIASRMPLTLSNKGSLSLSNKGSLTFKILPVDHNKINGMIIQIEDKIRLEVSDTKDQLICSPHSLKLSGFDIKTATDGSKFILYYHSTGDKTVPRLALRGGEVVMFLNKEHDAYISACGSQKVIAKANDGISRPVFQGGDCFWQIENATVQYNADSIKCETGIRIKHLPTQRYLAVEDNDQLTLKELPHGNHKDSATVFQLFKDTSGEDTQILKKRHVRIRLKSEMEKPETKNLSIGKSSIPGQKGFTISLEKNEEDFTKNNNQIFWIEEVDSGLLERFYVLSSAITTLKRYMEKITEVYKPPVIDELTKWTSEPPKGYQKRWPDMFRVIEGVDLIMEFLDKQTVKSSEDLQRQLCIILKNYVEHASEESQEYLSQHKLLHILFKKIGQDISAEEVLSALVKSSSFPSDKKKEFTQQLISMYEETPDCIDSAVLDCLSALCLSGTRGRPDRTIQEMLLKKIIIPGDKQGVFFKVTIEREDVILTQPKKPPKNDVKFLIAQIGFFASVCKGVNLNSIDTLTKILTFNAALLYAEDKSFGPDARSAFLTYLVSTLVDKSTEECGTDLENIWFIYARIHFVEKPFDHITLSGMDENINIISDKREMLKIIDFLQNESYDIEAGREELNTQRLTVLERLISYGFYWRNPEDVIEILIRILKMNVNGDIDVDVPSTETNCQVIFKLQAKAVELLHMFLKQTYHLSTARILSDYFYFVDDIYPDDFTPPKTGLRRFVNKEYKVSTDMHRDNREYEAKLRMKWLLYGDDDAYKLFDIHASDEFQTHKQNCLENRLIRLLQCDNETLCLSSAKLLFDLYQGECHLFERSEIAYIVVHPQNKHNWGIYVKHLNYATFQDKPIKILLKLLQGEGIKEIEGIKKYTNKVVFDCGYIPDQSGYDLADETIVHTTKQDIVFSTGVFGVFLNYVIKFCSTNEKQQKCLIVMVCDALVRVVRNNMKIKQVVFERFTDLLDAKLAISSVAHLLTEVLTDNIEACRQLPVFVVRRIFKLAMKDDNPEYNEYITTLVAWMKVKKFPSQPLKNHQAFITSLLIQHFRYHYRMLTVKNHGIIIEKLLNITYMLAVCAEGEHKYAEDECQHIFPFKKLVSIIAHPDIPIEQKTPFLFLLKEAYLHTKTKSLEAVVNFGNAKELWDHFKDTMTWITKLNGILQEESRKDEKFVDFVKIKMRVLFSQHLSYEAWQKHIVWKINRKGSKEDIEITLPISNSLAKEQRTNISTLLQYIVEGIIPLLSTFCVEYQKLFNDQLSVIPEHTTILKLVGTAVAKLVEDNREMFLTTESQEKFWEDNLQPFTKYICVPRPTLEEEFLKAAEGVVPINTEQDKEIPKTQECMDEETMNDEFKFYLKNFKKACYCIESELHDPDNLFPKFPASQKFLTIFFPSPPPTSDKSGHHTPEQLDEMKNVSSLVKLLGILHKQLQQQLDSKAKATFDRLLINTLQSLSGILHHHIVKLPDPLKAKKEHECAVEVIKQWQNVFVNLSVHEKALAHLDHVNDDVALQVLGLLKDLTYNANEHAQNSVFKHISSGESTFCERVYKLLENAIAVFNHPVLRQVEIKDTPVNESLSVSDQEGVISGDEDQVDAPEISLQRRHLSIIERVGNIEDSFEENIRTACIVLDCISSLCDGQHRKMQNLFQAQELSFREHYIVKKIATLLQVLSELSEKNWREILMNFRQYLSVIEKAIQALAKTCAGNYNNQRAVFQCQITITINVLLHKLLHDSGNPDDDKIKNLILKIIELMQVLLEETDKESSKLIINFSKDVDWGIIIETMFKWKIDWKYMNVGEGSIGIGCYHILHLVAHTLDVVCKIEKSDDNNQLVTTPFCESMKVKRKVSPDDTRIWDEFRKYSCHIEVMYKPIEEEQHQGIVKRNLTSDEHVFCKKCGHTEVMYKSIEEQEDRILTHVYFPFDPVHKLTESEKAEVNNGILEQTQEQSLTEFTKWTNSIQVTARYKDNIFLKNKWIYYAIYESSRPRHYILSFLTVLLNLLVLSVFKVPESQTVIATNASTNIILKPDTPLWYLPLLYILGSLHLILGMFMVVEHYVIAIPLVIKDFILYRWFMKQIYSLEEWATHQECLKMWCPLSWSEKKNLSTTASVRYFNVDLFGFQSIYRVLFVVSSFLAIGLSGYFYCFCLIYVILNIDIVQYMLTAIKRSALQLIYVAIVGEVLILIFSVIAFAFLHDYFENENELFCSTLWECFVTVTHDGWLSTIGTAIPYTNDAQSVPSFSTYTVRSFFFDLPFFVVISVIGRSVITAILINRFSELRGERDQINRKKFQYCFICGLKSQKFDRRSTNGFKNHVQEDHNKWNYIYYMIYLDRKYQTNPNDMTAMEKQVYKFNQISNNSCDITHFPDKRAKVLEAK